MPFANPIWMNYAANKFKTMMETVRDKQEFTQE